MVEEPNQKILVLQHNMEYRFTNCLVNTVLLIKYYYMHPSYALLTRDTSQRL
jgi:hypothetical protein